MKPQKNILVITYWDFDSPLIVTYTLPYLRLIKKNLPPGSQIFLLTLSYKHNKERKFKAVRDQLMEEGISLLNFNYDPFGIKMFMKVIYILFYLVVLSIRKKVRYIHAWCTPGGAIGYVVSLVTGRPLVLDSFEPHAESMVETGTWSKRSLAFRILFWFEKKQVQRAKHVICATASMKAYAEHVYNVAGTDFFVKPACVDLVAFDIHARQIRPSANHNGNITCVYAGKFGGIYLTWEVFAFFKVASDRWPGRFRALLLTDQPESEIGQYCKTAGLDPGIVTRKFVPHHEIAEHLAMADFAICPVKPVPTKQYCTPIKNGEYWAMGLPIVITKNISDDSAIILEEGVGYVLSELNEAEYRRAVEKIETILLDGTHLENIRKIAVKYRNFNIAEEIYRLIYAS